MADATGDIYDEQGRLQVGINTLGMVCKKSGSGNTVTKQVGNTTKSSLTVDVTGCVYPLVGIRIDNYAAAAAGYYTNANTKIWVTDAPIGTPFDYYIFDWSPALPNDGALTKMYDSTGRVTFNSNFFPMECKGFIGNGAGSFSTGGRTFCTVQGTMGGHSIRNNPVCYDSGGPALDPGEGLQHCRDIRYRNDGKLYGGSFRPQDQTCGIYAVSWDDVLVSAGNYDNYMNNDARGWEVPILLMCVDVTNIPVGTTFF